MSACFDGHYQAERRTRMYQKRAISVRIYWTRRKIEASKQKSGIGRSGKHHSICTYY